MASYSNADEFISVGREAEGSSGCRFLLYLHILWRMNHPQQAARRGTGERDKELSLQPHNCG